MVQWQEEVSTSSKTARLKKLVIFFTSNNVIIVDFWSEVILFKVFIFVVLNVCSREYSGMNHNST